MALKEDEIIKHLQWIYWRMIDIHNEKEGVDYMIKFNAIIDSIKQEASGSVAAPKHSTCSDIPLPLEPTECREIRPAITWEEIRNLHKENEVFYDNGEHSHLELLDHNGSIICSESELESLRDFVRDVDASLYHGPDLEDKEIMQHYIDVFKIIKEEARKLMNTYIQHTEQPEEAKIIEELKAKGARSFINENTALREALKELLPIVESKFNSISIDDAHSHREYIALNTIIERARNLLSK